jgi:hypothetical protein
MFLLKSVCALFNFNNELITAPNTAVLAILEKATLSSLVPAKVSSCFPLIFFVKPNSLAFKIAFLPDSPSNSFSRPNSLIFSLVTPFPFLLLKSKTSARFCNKLSNLEFSATTILEALAAASKGTANCLNIGISLTILFKPSKVLTEKFWAIAFDWDSTWAKFPISF